jgi:hypothetical protein
MGHWIEQDYKGRGVVVYPEGTRVRSVQFPRLTGIIKKHRRDKQGIISMVPFYIRWDNPQLAGALLVHFCGWGDANTVRSITFGGG